MGRDGQREAFGLRITAGHSCCEARTPEVVASEGKGAGGMQSLAAEPSGEKRLNAPRAVVEDLFKISSHL